MITVRAGSAAIGCCLLLLTAGCSREQQDWRSAESADTIDSYGQFIQHHPESELAAQARARVAQLGEDRDWQHAGSADSVEAYREFLAQHPSGKWAQEAHIRIENFSLGEQAGTDAGTKAASTAKATGATAGGAGAVTGANGAGSGRVPASTGAPTSGARSYGLAEPGEAATPAGGAPTAHLATAPSTSAAGSPRPTHLATAASTSAASTSASGSAPAPHPAAATPIHAATSHATPTAPAPTATTAARSSGSPSKAGFGIQLGAFSTEAGATNQWHVLTSAYASQLQGLQQHVVPAEAASGRIYRLQATVGDEGRARAICDQLKKHGQACVAVLPH